MKVEKIVNGFLDENCYIISNNEKECLIVDPGSEGEKIVSFIVLVIRNTVTNIKDITAITPAFSIISKVEITWFTIVSP